MAYALGKFARALCDRCAFEYKLSELKQEWNGAKVCSECYESKHPQLEPLTAKADPEALYKPRPNNDQEEGEGFVVVVNSNIYKPDFMNPSTLPTNFVVPKMTGGLGEVTIVIT
jgi:NMD protein affecting ribosome stability and mRNA decay